MIVFDYDALTDTATFAKPHEVSKGMRHVLVNGEVVLSDGKFNGKRSGRVLRGPGFDERTASYVVTTGEAHEAP